MPQDTTVQKKTEIPRDTGNADIYTRRYFDSLLIEMRLIDSIKASTEMTFLGEKFQTPIMLGAISGYDGFGENALDTAAEAAKELGTVLWVTGQVTHENVRRAAATGAKIIRVIKPLRDNDAFLDQVKMAEEDGCWAFASDIDHAFHSDGEYDGPEHQFGPKTQAELKAIVQSANLPFIAKGVLSVQDAVKCCDVGAKGILVSHHHGIMDYAVPPCLILPDIRKAVGNKLEIIADCGIKSGADVFKTLASGANAVCIARAYLGPWKKEGKEGIEKTVRTMNGSLRSYLERTSSTDIYHIDPTVLHKVNF